MIKIHGLALAIVIQDPLNPIEGQVWYNSTDDQLKFCDHNRIVQPVNDIYQGVTPPLSTHELIWLKTDDNVLFTYDTNQSKWKSIQKLIMNFNMSSRLYSGNFYENYHTKYAAVIRSIKTSDFDKVIIVRASEVDIYQFEAPFENFNLEITIPSNSEITCYTPTQIRNNRQLFIEKAKIYVEASWTYTGS